MMVIIGMEFNSAFVSSVIRLVAFGLDVAIYTLVLSVVRV